ncbi:hypothetical protein RND71_015647 [Anisodus tanguticus]|uniref:RNase H type-1 domain-containing protein n=1 Tax=Anisodus tanguticus TaxID=243964 RepID=A0AAE1S4N3_9SOLA|nr:hypothetical protein RND71_015647 [Anisodus tanguticus]
MHLPTVPCYLAWTGKMNMNHFVGCNLVSPKIGCAVDYYVGKWRTGYTTIDFVEDFGARVQAPESFDCGHIKCNTDGSRRGNTGRNCRGNLINAQAREIHETKNVEPKAIAIREVVYYCVSAGIEQITLKTDSFVVINILKREWDTPWKIINVIGDTRIRCNIVKFICCTLLVKEIHLLIIMQIRLLKTQAQLSIKTLSYPHKEEDYLTWTKSNDHESGSEHRILHDHNEYKEQQKSIWKV